MSKSSQAFRTIREVADWLDVAAHVLRFWESKFPQIKPVKRAGGRRYYRPDDMVLVGGIKVLLHDRGLTIRGVQKLIREEGVEAVTRLSPPIDALTDGEVIEAGSTEDWQRDAGADAQLAAPEAELEAEPEQTLFPFDPPEAQVQTDDATPDDRPADAEAEPEPEVALDTDVQAEAEVEPEAEVAPEPEIAPEPEVAPEAEVEAEAEVAPEPTPGPVAIEEPDAAPEPQSLDEPAPDAPEPVVAAPVAQSLEHLRSLAERSRDDAALQAKLKAHLPALAALHARLSANVSGSGG